MQRGLADDSEVVRESLHKTQILSDRARENFEIIDRENAEEQAMIEEAVRRMDLMQAEMLRELEGRRQENQRLRAQLQENRRLNQADQELVQPEYSSALTEQRARLKEAEADLKTEVSGKSQALRQFDTLDGNLAK